MQHSYSAPVLAPRPKQKQPSPLSQPMSLPGASQFVERERVRRVSSYTALDAVPEDSQSHGKPRRRPLPQPSHMNKGKAKMPTTPDQPMATPSAQWVLDLVETQNGRDRWLERSRVILVLGGGSGIGSADEDVKSESLAPILFNPVFQHTLVLVATPQSIPTIEALSRRADMSGICPTLKPISLKSSTATEHHLPALLDRAVELSKSYRAKTRKVGVPRRAESFGSASPPLSPPMRPSQYNSDSRASLSDSSESDRRGSIASRPGSRRESFFGLAKMADASNPQQSSSSNIPFDAVINFIPQSTEKSPQAALQQLLHQAVLHTTAVFPLLCRKSANGADNSPAITLLHVVQSGCPGPLPSVVESFLLNFIKSFPRGDRAVWAAVAPPSIWLSPSVSPEGDEISGAEVVLMGGIRCPLVSGAKPQAWIPGWSRCLSMPVLLGVGASDRTRQSLVSRVAPQIPAPTPIRDTLAWPAYTDYSSLSPADRSADYPFPTPPSTSGHSSPIPELDGAQSSASSTASLDAVVADTPIYERWHSTGTTAISNSPVDERLRQLNYVTVVEEKKEKKGWWKRKA